MENVRNSILQVNVICTDLDEQDPRVSIGETEYTGTCFRVDPHFLKDLPFYNKDKIFLITNFHVVDDADDRIAYLRTAAMGRSMISAYVEAVVPKLDCAVLSISRNEDHPRSFISKDEINAFLDNLGTVKLYEKRISCKPQKVSTIGFPHCLEEQVSEGCMAGRGSDDDDYLQLNLSTNPVNSGGPLVDTNGRLIGVCTSTLSASEAISIAVPSFSILNYFQKLYNDPFGRFPTWGMQCHAMTDAYRKVHNIRGVGALVNEVHPGSAAHGIIKAGDVIHSIGGHSLDMFGLIVDSTRGSKIKMDNTEFILGLDDYTVEFSTKENKRSVKIEPKPIHYKVSENWIEWNPGQGAELGPFIFQNLSTSLLTGGEVPADKSVELLDAARHTKSIKEIVIITKINPSSHVASFEVPEEYDRVLMIGRNKIDSMQDLNKSIATVKRMYESGEKYFNIKTTSGNMWFSLDRILSKKRKR